MFSISLADRHAGPSLQQCTLRFILGRLGVLIIGCCLLSLLASCTTTRFPVSSGTSEYSYISGNWQFVTQATLGVVPFQSFAGSIDEHSEDPGVDDSVVASFQISGNSACYQGAVLIPLQGSLESSELGLYSFTIVGQYLNLAATRDQSGTHLNGTYQIAGGCASGNGGTFSGTRYASVVGTYLGGFGNNAPQAVARLDVSQSLDASGDGSFPLSGSALITGISCFTNAQILTKDSIVLGSAIHVSLETNEPAGSTLELIGTFDAQATSIVISSAIIKGGNCSGSLGDSTLAKQG